MEDNNVVGPDDSSLETANPNLAGSNLTPLPDPPRSSFHMPSKKVILIIAVLLLGGAGAGLALTAKPAKPAPKTVVINTQTLDNGTLNKVTSQLGGGSQVNQQLTITPDTLFKNSVVIQNNLSLNGDQTVKGTSNLQGAVSTNSNLAVHGSLSVGGSSNLGGNLSVSGQITASSLSVGSLTIATIHLGGDLNFGGHLLPTGSTPAIKPSVAAGGGSTSVSGNDTAGTITISTGSGEPKSGEMAIINFHAPFATTPKVQLTPVNAASATIQYYVTQSATFFTVNAAGAPSKATSYTYNYLVTQ